MIVTNNCVEVVKYFEGHGPIDPKTGNYMPYICPAGVVTIGHGHVVLDSEGRRLSGKKGLEIARAMYPEGITPEEAHELLLDDIALFVPGVEKQLKVSTSQSQFDALVSFTYNVGVGAFSRSSLLRLHNAGKHTSKFGAYDPELIAKGRTKMFKPQNAPDAFLIWNGVIEDGVHRVLTGLYTRRLAERAVYLGEPWRKKI